MTKDYDFIIIGAGPAGMTAAVYASRAGMKTALLEAGAPGGKLLKTHKISNWPGIKEEPGSQLAMDMFEHSTSFGAVYEYGNVIEIRNGERKQVICEDGTIFTAPAVLVATGGKGISYCAVCDGAFFRDKETAVIGGGNSALEEAVYLTQFASKVYLIMRRDVFRAEKAVIDTVLSNPKIELLQNYIPLQVLDNEGRVGGLEISHTRSGETKVLPVSGIFPYIGADPITGFLKDLPVLDKQGYIVVNSNMETSVSLLFGAGDVCQKELRQVVTAASDGAIAAQTAFRKLQESGFF